MLVLGAGGGAWNMGEKVMWVKSGATRPRIGRPPANVAAARHAPKLRQREPPFLPSN